MIIKEILDYLNSCQIPYEFCGNLQDNVEGFSSLSKYKDNSFTWVKASDSIPLNFDFSRVSLIFLQEGVNIPSAKNMIISPCSKKAFFSTIENFFKQNTNHKPIGEHTYISSNVKLGNNVRIGHNCTIDGNIIIGDNTVIWNNVIIINNVKIGKNCDIHSGVVIGHDGFAYSEDENHKKTMIEHYGGVSIGNDVFIGENVCISRGTIDDTVLEDGVKIDSLSHIAHNCHFKKNSAAAAPCRTNGSVVIGENAYLAGALVRNQCVVGDNAFVGLGAVVVKNVEPNQIVVGNPAKPFEKNK